MYKRITTILNSPLGYKYKSVFIYKYIIENGKNVIINGTFYIGNPKTKPEDACVTIAVFYPFRDSFVDSSIASLILVKHYETCSENKDLQQGEGTIDMMNTSMSFVKQICSFVKEFKLNDASTKKCDNDANISLPYFYITQKNMTWYEGRFGAYLKEPEYTSYKNKILEIMNTLMPEFDIFKANHIKNTPPRVIDELKSVYVEGSPLKLFFTELYKKYDKSMGCILLQPWIDIFMKNVGLHKYIVLHEWYISSEKIPTYHFNKNNKTYKVNTFNNTRKIKPWNK